MRTRTLLGIAALLGACEGPAGPPGPPGVGYLPDGGSADAGDRDADAAVDAGAPSGALTGQVREPSGALVGRGRIVLVPSERVAALATSPIDLSLPGSMAAQAANDEPLEDAIAADPALASATVGSDGSYRLEAVPDGALFLVYVPDPTDEAHLPGGQLARAPLPASDLRGASIDVLVSGSPSPRARYVGSSSCVNCHAQHATLASAHALTLRVPGRSTPLQDVSAAPRIDEALAAFAAGTELFFSECDPARTSGPLCRIGTSAPADAASVALRVTLGRDLSVSPDVPGHFYAELERGGTRVRHPIALTLGGARTAQQYVVRSALAGGGFTHFVLPFTYQLYGDPARPDPRDHRWVAYRVEDWLDLAAGSLRLPPNDQAFERQCAGCHVTGYVGGGSVSEGYRARAAVDRDGIYDLDGDGRKELLAVGCESCHGPGSEHLELTPRARRIVSPQLLTPERQSLLCGQCHARYVGRQGELAPLDETRRMPRPGISRSAFLARHVARMDTGPDVRFPTGDPRVGFQQYGDFVRSTKYRNGQLLVTCSECHDPHRSAGFPFDLRDLGGNAACAGCHAAERDVHRHAAATTRFAHDRGVEQEALTCTTCHMVRTGASGARLPALVDHDSAGTVVYLHGDRATHRFEFVDRTHIAEQPVAATAACGSCHGSLFITP